MKPYIARRGKVKLVSQRSKPFKAPKRRISRKLKEKLKGVAVTFYGGGEM